MGQASPQPIVTTTSAAVTNSSVSGLGNSLLRSRPISLIAWTTAGLIALAGSEPADRTWTLPCPRLSRSAAAICERPALCTHTNRTSGTSLKLALHQLRQEPARAWSEALSQLIEDPDPFLMRFDKSGFLQLCHVMRDRRLAQLEIGSEVADADRLPRLPEGREHSEPRRIAKSLQQPRPRFGPI